MNILIYMSGGFDVHGPSNHLFSTLIEDLLSYRHHVFLVQRVIDNKNNELNSNVLTNNNFHNFYVSHKIVEKNKLVKRYFNSVNYAHKSKYVLKNVFLSNKIDVVLVQSNPTPYFQLRTVRKFFKGPIVFNVQDIFPGSTIAAGKMKSKLMQLFFTWLSKKAYSLTDHITVISEDSKRLLVSQGVPEEKVSVILNWFNSNQVKEIQWENNLFVKKYNLKPNYFYIQYAGGMGFVFDYFSIIKLAEKVIDYKDIQFLMIGDGSQKKAFVDTAKKLNLDNIHFYPMQPQDEVSDVYSACDIQLIPLNRKIIGNSVPSKAALVMACRRLIVNSVDEDSEYYERFILNKIGVSVSNLNNDELFNKILDIYFHKNDYKQMIENAYKFTYQYYSRNVCTNLYNELFKKLIEVNHKRK